MANRVIRRDDVKASFRPIVPLLEIVIAEARAATTFSVVAKSNPDVTRDGHIRRLGGTKRWMLVADGLVRESDFPEGFEVISTEGDHNRGRYVFRFPGGVFTVKKHPHKEDEGAYLQEQLEAVLEQAPLADGIAAEADLKVFLSVPERAPARLIVTHPALDRHMVIFLDEIMADEVPPSIPPTEQVRPTVRSLIKPEGEEEKPADNRP
jgi:hypothetical protein